MVDENKETINFKIGSSNLTIPAVIILTLISTIMSGINSCNSSKADNTKLETKIDSLQTGVSELKSDVKSLNEKVMKDNQDLTNRIGILEYKTK